MYRSVFMHHLHVYVKLFSLLFTFPQVIQPPKIQYVLF